MTIAIIAASAFLGAMINAIAGGGTFLTFPALTGLAKLTEKVANVTSTIGLWPGYAGSIVAARREMAKLSVGVVLGYSVIGAVGGLLGAVLLLRTPTTAFRYAIPWLLLFSTVVFALGKRINRWARREKSSQEARMSISVIPLLMVISIYNGYFGAGAGVLMLAGLSLAGLQDIQQMNTLKTLIQVTANAAAIAIFMWSDVNWRLAGVMGAASLAGGFLGMLVCQRVPQGAVKGLVLAIGATLTILFFIKTYG